MTITLPTSSNTTNPRSFGYGAAIGDLLVRLAPTQGRELTVVSSPSQAQRVQTSELPEEMVVDVGEVFARSDFTGGEGLREAHRRLRQDSDAARYWDSHGVKIEAASGGRRTPLCLLEATEEVVGTDATTPSLVVVGGAALFTTASGVSRISNPATGTTATAEDPYAGEGVSGAVGTLTAAGNEAYVALGANGIHKRASGGTWEHANDLDCDQVWYIRGRVMAAHEGDLYEWADLTSDTAPSTALISLPAGQSWVGVVDAADAILAAATDGNVYALDTNESGDLVLIGQTEIQNETPTSIAVTQGVVLVGTFQTGEAVGRLWAMALSDGGTLQGQVVREWDNHSPRCIAIDRESAYAAVYDGDRDEITIWRYDVTQAAMYRWWTFPAADSTQQPTALAWHAGRLLLAAKGYGVGRVSDAKVTEGWLIGPLGDFYTVEDKTWTIARVEVGSVPIDTEVEVLYTTAETALDDSESSSWVPVTTVTSPTSTLDVPIGNVVARRLAIQVRLRGDGSVCPEVQSFSMLAYLAAGAVVATLPVVVSDLIERPWRRGVRVPGLGSAIYQRLLELDKQSVLLQIYRGPQETIRGQVEEIATPVPMLSRRGSSMLVSLVRVRGRRVDLSGAASSWATTTWGSAPWGGA